MKTGRYRIPLVALCVMLLFSSCESSSPEISITFESDYGQLVAAIENVNQSLTDRMSLLEAAMESGLADGQAAIALVRKAVETLGGDMEKKLAAVSEAVKSQGTSLETKLALIEAAADAGFADAQARQVLLQEALASLGGSLEEKMTALEAVVRKQTTDLDTKLDLIEAAVKDGLADSEAAQGLMKEALASLGGSMEQQLAAIDSTLGSQQTTLSAKLALIETALQEGFAEGKTRQELIQQALDSLSGDQALAAIDSALTSLTSGMETKLALIESAYTKGFSSEAAVLQQLQTAVTATRGSVAGMDKDADAVLAALGTVDPASGTISALLTQIQTSVSGLSSYDALLKNIWKSIGFLAGSFGGHEGVNLGNGVFWATCNVGARQACDTGYFFAWGETEPKTAYTWDTYFDTKDHGRTFEKYALDKKTVLEPEDDAARQNWGGFWSTPTDEEWTWLLTNCTYVWKENYNESGINGMLVTSKINGNNIFLPAAGSKQMDEGRKDLNVYGRYWSSTLSVDNTDAKMVYFADPESGSLEAKIIRSSRSRGLDGLPVRPVIN